MSLNKIKINENTEQLIADYNELVSNPISNQIEVKEKIRGIIESVIETVGNGDTNSALNLISEGKIPRRFLSFYVNLINNSTHGKIVNSSSLEMNKRHFNTFWNLVKDKIIFETQPLFFEFGNEEFTWSHSVNNRIYDALILSEIEYDDYFKLSYFKIAHSSLKNGHNQKSSHRIYIPKEMEEDFEIAKNETYKIGLSRKKLILNNEMTNVQIEFLNKLEYVPTESPDDPLILKSILEFKNKWVEQTNENVFQSIVLGSYFKFKTNNTSSSNSILLKEFYEILKNDLFSIGSFGGFFQKKLDAFYKNMAFMKKPNISNLNNILQKKQNLDKISPMCSEFWTKNTFGSKFTIFEKEIILLILNEIGILIGKDYAFAKMNEIEYLKLLHNEELYVECEKSEFDKKFPDNNKFKTVDGISYFQKKLVEIEEGRYVFYDESEIIKKFNNKISSELSQFSELSFEKRIAEIELEFNNIKSYNKPPKEYVEKFKNAFLNNNVFLVQGHAGTGKTTLASFFARVLIKEGCEITFAAPTHKSKMILRKKMTEIFDEVIVGLQESTTNSIGNINIKNNVKNILIIDEFSMISKKSWENISKRINDFDKIIIMGDEKQLPPINSICMSRYFLRALKKRKIILDQNLRTGNKDILNNLLLKIRNSEPLTNERYIFEYANYSELFNYLKGNEIDVNSMILTPYNGGPFGVQGINSILNIDNFNFEQGENITINDTISNKKFKDYIHWGNDAKIEEAFQEKNAFYFKTNLKINNDLLLEVKNDNEVEMQLSFYIIDKNDNRWMVDESGYIYFMIESELYENDKFVTRSKVLTIHKSQGSTYVNTLVIIPPGHSMDNRMLYTALSRSKLESTILIHSSDKEKWILNKEENIKNGKN